MARASQHRSASIEQKGLPARPDLERMVLGSALLDPAAAAGVLTLTDDAFSLAAHRTILGRMRGMAARGVSIDRVTVAHELLRYDELDGVGGLTYLASLDDGLPRLVKLDDYLRILREQAALRKTIYGAQKLTDGALTGMSTEELQATAEGILVALGESEQESGPQTPGEIIQAIPGGLQGFLGPRKQGLLTGFYKLDEMTAGLHPGNLVILAARPSMGKTALALNIAAHAALTLRKTVMLFSLEMSKLEILHRLVCTEAHVDSQRVRANYLNAEERQRLAAATRRLADAPLLIDDASAATTAGLHAKIRKQMARGPLDLVVVDYLQLMVAGGKTENRNQEVTAISRGMKLLAKEISAPLLVLSQLSRAPELRKGNNRPQLSDLRESGSIEQDADVVAFIFREEVYAKDRDTCRGKAELILAKQRSGPIGTINLTFRHQLVKFENAATDVGEEPAPLLKGRGKDDAAADDSE
jgi:replicative DNA helicase